MKRKIATPVQQPLISRFFAKQDTPATGVEVDTPPPKKREKPSSVSPSLDSIASKPKKKRDAPTEQKAERKSKKARQDSVIDVDSELPPQEPPITAVQSCDIRIEDIEHGDIPDMDEDRHRKFVESLAPLSAPMTSNASYGDIDDLHLVIDTGKTLSGKPKPTATNKRKTKSIYTPLEQQYLKFRAEQPDAMLLVECGYKYRFFDKDAQIASQVLNIFSHVDHNFLTASIPVHRLPVHVRRLVEAGHKVAVVRQAETAALKAAGNNASKLFERKISSIYTKATLISEELDALDSLSTEGENNVEDGFSSKFSLTSVSKHLMCLWEEGFSVKHGPRRTSLVSVDMAAGEVVYDEFEDDVLRSGLETRLQTLRPCEILLPGRRGPAEKETETEEQTEEDEFSKLCKSMSYSDKKKRAQEEYEQQFLLSDDTEKAITAYLAPRVDVRVERRPCEFFDPSDVGSRLTDFFSTALSDTAKRMTRLKANQKRSDDSDDDDIFEDTTLGPKHNGSKRVVTCPLGERKGNILSEVLQLGIGIQVCFSVLCNYLSEFRLTSVLRAMDNLKPFHSVSRMRLEGSTMQHLDIFPASDGTKVPSKFSSLFGLLQNTSTAFGTRLLRKWVAEPLLVQSEICARQSAVKELLQNRYPWVRTLKDFLKRVPDLERGLVRINLAKVSPKEFLAILTAFQSVLATLPASQVIGSQVDSSLLREILLLPVELSADVSSFMNAINEKGAQENDKMNLFRDEHDYPDIVACKEGIASIKKALKEHLLELRRSLRKPTLEYACVSGQEYLVELTVAEVPRLAKSDWIVISSTKEKSRFHTPFITAKLQRLAELNEQLDLAASAAWTDFLQKFGDRSQPFRTVVRHLSVLDCLFSLTTLAQTTGYCCPEFVQGSTQTLIVEDGRHPMVEHLLSESSSYVPNSISLCGDAMRSLLITGPNMGGKSCYSKQIALLVIMAQVGSFVPASSMKLSIFDGVFTRMGATDNIGSGQSTFLVELQQTSNILKKATDRSLVILDELGRGTSTHDGVAIAYATLQHMLESIRCLTLFVTHYPVLGQLESRFPGVVSSWHMAYLEQQTDFETSPNGHAKALPVVTFLYRLVPGLADRSYGLNVARLAQIPESVLAVANRKSAELEDEYQTRSFLKGTRHNLLQHLIHIFDPASELTDKTKADRIAEAIRSAQSRFNSELL
eukprot:GILJ01011467.1.p1 GENE.GILJ01011467.1~~GILJ01011467.1.p1  ORF type:complete len:1188 (+),score=212.58 GILJ01011467.1:2-3565(+)